MSCGARIPSRHAAILPQRRVVASRKMRPACHGKSEMGNASLLKMLGRVGAPGAGKVEECYMGGEVDSPPPPCGGSLAQQGRGGLPQGGQGFKAQSRNEEKPRPGGSWLFVVEARGVEPLSWTPLTQASPCSDADCCSRRCAAPRQPCTKPVTCGCHTQRGHPAAHLPTKARLVLPSRRQDSELGANLRQPWRIRYWNRHLMF